MSAILKDEEFVAVEAAVKAGVAPPPVAAAFNELSALRAELKKLGEPEMGLFAIDTEFVGPGMPLWLPKGTVLVEELEKLAKETEFAAGYVRVRTPHLAREKMYKTSGHLPYYAESMFPKMEMDEHRTDRKEIEQRIAELEKQLADHAKKAGSPASGNP